MRNVRNRPCTFSFIQPLKSFLIINMSLWGNQNAYAYASPSYVPPSNNVNKTNRGSTFFTTSIGTTESESKREPLIKPKRIIRHKLKTHLLVYGYCRLALQSISDDIMSVCFSMHGLDSFSMSISSADLKNLISQKIIHSHRGLTAGTEPQCESEIFYCHGMQFQLIVRAILFSSGSS